MSYVPRRRAGRREFGVDISNVDPNARQQAIDADNAAQLAGAGPLKGGNHGANNGIRKGKRKASEMDMDDVILDVADAQAQPAKRPCRYDLRSRRPISRSNSAAVAMPGANDSNQAGVRAASTAAANAKDNNVNSQGGNSAVSQHAGAAGTRSLSVPDGGHVGRVRPSRAGLTNGGAAAGNKRSKQAMLEDEEDEESADSIAVHLDDLDMDGPMTRSRTRRLREQKKMELQRRRAKSRPNRERVGRPSRLRAAAKQSSKQPVRSASLSDDHGSASDSEAMDGGMGMAGRNAAQTRRSRAIGRRTMMFGGSSTMANNNTLNNNNRGRRGVGGLAPLTMIPKVQRVLVIPQWDRNDTGNELASVAYATDIVTNLFNCESHTPGMKPVKDYMARQNDLSSRMRLILLDWLLDVHRKFDLATATLYLCVSLLDRYLGKPGVQVEKSKLQLTGCACLWIASKYHEIYAPEINDFVYISDDAFTQDELILKESDIVSALNFNLTVPTPLAFVERFLKVLLGGCMDGSGKSITRPRNKSSSSSSSSSLSSNGGGSGRNGGSRSGHGSSGPSEKMRLAPHLTHYLLEHSLMHYDVSTRHKASQISAAAVCYATLCLQIEKQWPMRMQKVTNYTVIELMPVIQVLDGILKANTSSCKHKAVRKKYSHSRFGRVSMYQYRGFSISGWKDEMMIRTDEEDL